MTKSDDKHRLILSSKKFFKIEYFIYEFIFHVDQQIQIVDHLLK
jgi:hypothetical protein